jgi:signal transduction histidine kinase
VKPDTTSALPTAGEAAWVEAELVRGLMRTQRTTQILGLLLIPLVLAVLWPDVQRLELLGWSVLTTGAAAARFLVMRFYAREVAQADPDEQLAFLRRWGLVWPVTGAVWGLSTLLYFDRASLPDQFVCWLVLSGLSMFAINTLSSHVATMRAYLDALAGTALAVMLWRIGVELRFAGPAYHWWMVLLLAIFWQVLRQAGQRQHVTLRKNYELQYRNKQLIESLTRQTQAALDAVEIKNRFLASAAHDIRQPVHALGLYADWLGSEP